MGLTAGAAPWAFLLLLAAALLRGIAGRDIEARMGATPSPIWLPLLRDLLSVAVLLAAYAGERSRLAWPCFEYARRYPLYVRAPHAGAR